MSAKPPVEIDLQWQGGLRFAGPAGRLGLTLDGDGQAGPTPVEALALALAGCMAVDVVHILGKGRYNVKALGARLVAHRADTEPRRFLAIALHFRVAGDVPEDKIQRALSLSREKYCSVWHSLRPDIDFTTSFERASPAA